MFATEEPDEQLVLPAALYSTGVEVSKPMSHLDCRRQGCETISAGMGKPRDSSWLAVASPPGTDPARAEGKRGAETAHELPATDLMLPKKRGMSRRHAKCAPSGCDWRTDTVPRLPWGCIRKQEFGNLQGPAQPHVKSRTASAYPGCDCMLSRGCDCVISAARQ